MDPPPAADDRTAAYAENLLGGCLAAQGRFAEAEPLLLGSLSGLEAAPNVSPVASVWPWSGSFAFMSSGAGLKRQASGVKWMDWAFPIDPFGGERPSDFRRSGGFAGLTMRPARPAAPETSSKTVGTTLRRLLKPASLTSNRLKNHPFRDASPSAEKLPGQVGHGIKTFLVHLLRSGRRRWRLIRLSRCGPSRRPPSDFEGGLTPVVGMKFLTNRHTPGTMGHAGAGVFGVA